MGNYRTKEIDFGYKKQIKLYTHPVKYGNKNPVPINGRQKYSEMTDVKKMLSDDRRVKYYKGRVAELKEIALMNPDLGTAVTLTFRDPVTSYDLAVAEWQSFLKRLRHYTDRPLKYICVWEYQKARSLKEGIVSGGVFHFHALMNIGFIEHSKLERVWGKGFVWIDQLGHDRKREKAVGYTLKYIVKEVISRIENGEDVRGQRFFFASNNLCKPTTSVREEAVNIEDVIFEHMETVVKDGSYDLRNEREEVINHVDYVIYNK